MAFTSSAIDANKRNIETPEQTDINLVINLFNFILTYLLKIYLKRKVTEVNIIQKKDFKQYALFR
jgi:hypothetical protein